MLLAKYLTETPLTQSSIGVLRKWYNEENKTYIKSSSYDSKKKIYHVESVMECIASEVAILLGINAVKYHLDTLKDLDGSEIVVCVSDDYMSDERILRSISAEQLLIRLNKSQLKGPERYSAIVQAYPTLRTSLDKMLSFDFVISNYDRHFRNFDFVQYRDGTIDLSPIYDSGASLLSDYVTDEDLEWLLEDEDQYEEVFVTAETPARGFVREHISAFRLVQKESLADINQTIKEEEFVEIVRRYDKHLSPLRSRLIIQLLNSRYKRLLHFMKTK